MRRMSFSIGLLLLFTLCLAGCDKQDPAYIARGVAVPIIQVYQGQQAWFLDQAFCIIRNRAAWRALWGSCPAPEVDFSRNAVLVATMGRQETSGYEIDITDVRIMNDRVVAFVREYRPKKTEVVAKTPTYPYKMVAIQQTDLPAYFVLKGQPEPVAAIQDFFYGARCLEKTPRTPVIRDAREWKQLWQDSIGDPAPEVDFTRYQAVAIFLGVKPSSGYSVKIVSVTHEDDRIIITYRLFIPGPDEVVKPEPSSPYAAALIPISAEPVVFRAAPPENPEKGGQT